MRRTATIEPQRAAEYGRAAAALERIAALGWRLNWAIAPYLLLALVTAATVRAVISGVWAEALPSLILLAASAARRYWQGIRTVR